jgi:hypothetical protein
MVMKNPSGGFEFSRMIILLPPNTIQDSGKRYYLWMAIEFDSDQEQWPTSALHQERTELCRMDVRFTPQNRHRVGTL